MGKFLATSPFGTVLKVFAGVVLAGFVTYLNQGGSTVKVHMTDVISWVDAALIVAVPLIINLVNPADTRYGKGSG